MCDGLFHSSRHTAVLCGCACLLKRGTKTALRHLKASSQSSPAELLSAPPPGSPSPRTEPPLPTADVILVTRSLVCAHLRDAPVHYVAVKNSSGFTSGTSAPPFSENSGTGVIASSHGLSHQSNVLGKESVLMHFAAMESSWRRRIRSATLERTARRLHSRFDTCNPTAN